MHCASTSSGPSTSSASQWSGLVLDSHLRVWGFGDTKSTIIYTLVTCEKWRLFLYIWGKLSSFTKLKEGFLPVDFLDPFPTGAQEGTRPCPPLKRVPTLIEEGSNERKVLTFCSDSAHCQFHLSTPFCKGFQPSFQILIGWGPEIQWTANSESHVHPKKASEVSCRLPLDSQTPVCIENQLSMQCSLANTMKERRAQELTF